MCNRTSPELSPADKKSCRAAELEYHVDLAEYHDVQQGVITHLN